MKKLFRILILFIIYLYSNYNISQVLNIDREGSNDTVQTKIKSFFTLNFSSDKQKKNIIDFVGQSETDFFLKNNYFILILAQSELSFLGKSINESNGYLQFRFRDNDSRKVAPDFYSQVQFNNIQGLENRFISGVNARINLFEKRKSDLFLSIGSFYEMERWNTKMNGFSYKSLYDTAISRNIFRLNTTLKFALKLSDKIDFIGTTYLQFPLNKYFNQPRWYIDSKLFFNFSDHLNFIIQYDQNLDYYRALPISNYYYSLSLGMNFKF